MALRLRIALQDPQRRGPTVGSTAPAETGEAALERELTRLESPPGKAPRSEDAEVQRLQERLAQRTRRNQGNRSVTQAPLPLYQLLERAGLDALATELFLLALAPEIDEGFGRALAALSVPAATPAGGARNKRPLDLATAARVLTPEDVGAGALRKLLSPGAALCDLGLIDHSGHRGADAALASGASADGRGGLTLATTLHVPPPVVAYVLGQSVADPALRLFVRVHEGTSAAPQRRDAFLPDEIFAHAAALWEDSTALPCLEGPPGVGKALLAQILCAEQGRDLVEADVRSAPEGLSRGETVALTRLCFLRDATLLLRLPRPEDARRGAPPWQAGVLDLLARNRTPTRPTELTAAPSKARGRALLVLCRDSALTASGISDAGSLELAVPSPLRLAPLSLPPPEVKTREALWRDRLTRPLGGAARAVAADLDYALLARSYPLTAGVITRIADEAHALARARAATQADLSDVLRSIEAEFRPRLQTVGRRLVTRAKLGDLVLAEETRDTLQEMEATVRLRHRVLDDWGFQRLVHGRGVSALFYGEPGTGKTLAAGVIAAACGLPLYQIDTAQVVSKWVGETEKNLSEVFRAAEAGHAMLLFDEADAIFGKRTDVQHSTDRFANMQTNFLLTQIESFNGVVVLTTNKESVMDPAFQRRLTFRVHFPMPDEKEREELWRRMLADVKGDAQLERVHFTELARRLQMSGGYIRNAVLRAAYQAAAGGAPITTTLLRGAAELVLRDAGKVI